jgi:predicted molibdopterin-dependent oxidoreductase YjgC
MIRVTINGHARASVLTNHVLYCTLCDNNNGACTITVPSLIKRIIPIPSTAMNRKQRILFSAGVWRRIRTSN